MKRVLLKIFIIFAIVSIFSIASSANASQENPQEECNNFQTSQATNKPCKEQVGTCTTIAGSAKTQIAGLISNEECSKKADSQMGITVNWVKGSAPDDPTATKQVVDGKTPFEAAVSKKVCVLANPVNGTMMGCVLNVVNVLFYNIPSFLLWYAAYLFNVLISITLNSSLFSSSTFLTSAWTVVRDLSNVFFIIILLYISIKIILGLTGHGVKETIVKVLLMAFLINFSLFFTGVVIDASNILALVFYNKLDVQTSVNGKERAYTSAAGEKDVSGGMVQAFNATSLLDQEFLDNAGTIEVPNSPPIKGEISDEMLIGIIIIAGLLMYFTIYCFIIAGLSFVGRMIELFVLIIFSPFAFMSSTLHGLSHTEYIGWDHWSKKLISSAFMAPIFMFFLYFIFMLIQSPIFKDMGIDGQGTIGKILAVTLPAIIILTLLLKATEYAKKGSGQFGEAVIGAAKMGAVLGIGGAAGATALAGRATVGAFMKGASTGDTAAQRMRGSATRIQNQRNIINDPNSTLVQRWQARREIFRERKDEIKGGIQQALRIDRAQTAVGQLLNQDQHNVQHAAHARHELDEYAGKIAHGKKWDDLNGDERYQVRRQMARDRVVRDNAGATPAALGNRSYVAGLTGLGNRKWDSLTTTERDLIDASMAVGDDHGHAIPGHALHAGTSYADDMIADSRIKQGLISSVIQSSVTGTYDARNLANIIAKEQSTFMAKFGSTLTGLMAKGMRGGLHGLGINAGKAEGKFFKDLADTIGESLKNIKIKVDLSHVGEVKHEDGHGGHGGGHH